MQPPSTSFTPPVRFPIRPEDPFARRQDYVHWTFHRDERQCTPAFTQYFILAEKPHQREKGGVVDRPEAPHAIGGGAAGDASRPAGAGAGGDAPGSSSAVATAPAEAPAAPQPPAAGAAADGAAADNDGR